MTKIWITRTRPAADESANVWREAGYDPIVEPLLAIESVQHGAISKDVSLIFTSKNGVDHVVCDGQRAICVGDGTAEHARQAGFMNVVSVDGVSVDVTNWVRKNVIVSQPIVHISGWHVRGSIVEDLQASGYHAKRVKVYRSVPTPIWLNTGFSSVALYSPLAARTFRESANSRDVSGIKVVCISQATADELDGLSFQAVKIAARPREDELIMAARSR